MRDVSLRVVVVFAVILAFACIAPGQAAGKAKAQRKAPSAFDQLDATQLIETLSQLGMGELKMQLIKDSNLANDKSLKGRLLTAGIAAEAMRQITDPADCLVAGKRIIALLEEALDLAEKEMEAAEEAAEKAPSQTKTGKLLAASRAAYTYFDILYRLGDMSGRQAIGPYARKVMYLQGNREDRRIILEMTKNAVLDLRDMQAELKDKLRDWQEHMSVWMIMGSNGENLLRDSQYWSTRAYLYRAMALGDAEAHETEREEIRGAFRRMIAQISEGQTASREKLNARLQKDLGALADDQKKRTAQRRELLLRVLMLLPQFEDKTRFKVAHDVRRLMAIAHRELDEYDKAIDKLAPKRYQGASGAMRMMVAMELPITLVKQGKYSEVPKTISDFKDRAEEILGGKGKKLTEMQQAQVDLQVAMLKEYLYRHWAAASTSPADKSRHRAEGEAAMVEFLDKYKSEGIRRSFIDFFGNRLLYTQDIDELSSVQLYIIASGAAARNEPEKRRAMLETILSRENDPAAKKLAAPAHWQLAMAMNELGRNIDAANNFIAVVNLLAPDNPRAPRAAQNASICMERYVTWYETNKKRSIPRSVRLKCAEALKYAVGFDAKYPKLKLSEWYYSLGRHCDKLSQGGCPAKDVVGWMQQAADAFGKVPAEPPGKFFNAQELWLDLRYRALKRGKMDAKAMATAVKLREQYGQFVQRIEKFIAGLPDKESDQAKALTESAAWADFTRAKLLSEQMRQEAKALVDVVTLLKKWSTVDSVVVAASQWKIQGLIDLDKIEEASAELRAFMKANEKDPDAGAGLIEQVIEGIRKAIDNAQAKSGNEAKLAAYRKSYLQLAEILYAPVKDKPIEGTDGKVDDELLTLTQLWIDALVQNDRGIEALELALKCRLIFDKRREAQTKKIEEKYAPRIRACKAAIGLPAAIAKLVKDFKDELVKRSKDPGADDFDPEEDARPVVMMLDAMKSAIADGADAGTIKRRTASVSLELETGYREIIRRLKNRIPVELTIEWNVAKCLASTGKYSDSLLIYLRLIKGTDPQAGKDSKRRFWRLQLEYCQTYLKALSKDKERMGKLVAYIETDLKNIGGDLLGGFKVEFFAVKEKARRLSE